MPDKSVNKAMKDILWQTIDGPGRFARNLLLSSKKPAPKVNTTTNFQVKRSGKSVGKFIGPGDVGKPSRTVRPK